MYVKVKDDISYVRDTTNRAIINVDSSGLEAYKSKKKILQAQKNQMNNLIQDVSQLKDEISEIKELLVRMLNK